ncbi:MAG TPA: cellulase family glycosylhydrolase [Kiritimatiellia bacterium]|nr:cellulase family glycosylhydrolase [Kiritimatiellia bacterium]HPS09194.1 cellulase family glycosylhydrolase [Kiritimatiellia bacterium]
MKTGCLMAALLPLAGMAGEAVLSMGGALKLDSPGVELNGCLFTAGWKKSVSGGGTAAPDEKGVCAFVLKASEQEQVAGTADVTPAADGAARAVYTFTPESDILLNGLYVNTHFSAQKLIGGRWQADAKEGVFPEKRGALSVFSGKVKQLAIAFPPPAGERLVFTFDAPTSVLIQDDRQWGETFSLRLGGNGAKTYSNGVPCRVAFTLKAHAPLKVVYDRPVTLQANEEWVPLTYEKEILPGSALDFSGMKFVDAPAGKYGWLKAQGPHFEFEQKPGAPQRFYGVNFCGTANFPSAEQSEQLADRFVRLGYNSIRIHHYDNGCVQGSPDGLTLNPGQMAKLDGFIAACMKRGLYVTTDLFVSRKVMWRHIGIDREGQVEMQVFKALIAVHEPSYQNWATFAKALLTHVNPHTGRRYADEPGMPFIALINEGSIGYSKQEARETPAMQAAWAAWLKQKRAQDPAFAEIPDTMPLTMNGKAGSAVALFVADTEAKMVARMKAFLRDEIGCKALISNYNCGTHYQPLQPVREALYDYVDDHFYVDHPHFLEKKWSLPSRCGNENPLRSGCRTPCNVAFTRLANKPFTVSEYNFSGPGMFRGVGGIMTGAMGALQDWSALWRFAYAHRLENMFDGEGSAGYFDVATDPLSQASDRASLCLFLRGDLAPAAEKVAVALTPNEVAVLKERAASVPAAWSGAAWNVRVGTYAAEAALPGWRVVSGGEAYATNAAAAFASLTNDAGALAIDPARGAFTITTARTVGGFAETGTVSAGPLSVSLSGAAATVWVSALDAAPVTESGRLLMTHLTDVQNTGVRYAERARKTLLSWGKTPYLMRAGQADVKLALKDPGAYTVYALATNGRRLEKVAATAAGGKLCFMAAVANPGGARMLYEIVRE